MQDPHASSLDSLIGGLDGAVRQRDVQQITSSIKETLQSECRCSAIRLPERFLRPNLDCYARRLLHRDPSLGYTVVVMTWGPGQQTPLHDHAGIWCVECVVQGELSVIQYDMTCSEDGRYRFRQQRSIRAGVGDAGCLIPPFEYHVLSNQLEHQTSISLHVYGGEMDHCHAYKPLAEGWWERE